MVNLMTCLPKKSQLNNHDFYFLYKIIDVLGQANIKCHKILTK